eukprot:jgi/Chrzof1/2226/Cz11g07120.t1
MKQPWMPMPVLAAASILLLLCAPFCIVAQQVSNTLPGSRATANLTTRVTNTSLPPQSSNTSAATNSTNTTTSASQQPFDAVANSNPSALVCIIRAQMNGPASGMQITGVVDKPIQADMRMQPGATPYGTGNLYIALSPGTRQATPSCNDAMTVIYMCCTLQSNLLYLVLIAWKTLLFKPIAFHALSGTPCPNATSGPPPPTLLTGAYLVLPLGAQPTSTVPPDLPYDIVLGGAPLGNMTTTGLKVAYAIALINPRPGFGGHDVLIYHCKFHLFSSPGS